MVVLLSPVSPASPARDKGAFYLRDLAADFHTYYNAHQFIITDAELRDARLLLIQAVRQVLNNGLKLLGMSAPERM